MVALINFIGGKIPKTIQLEMWALQRLKKNQDGSTEKEDKTIFLLFAVHKAENQELQILFDCYCMPMYLRRS